MKSLISVSRGKLLESILAAILISTVATVFIESSLSRSRAERLIMTNLAELDSALEDSTEREMLTAANLLSRRIGSSTVNSPADRLADLAREYGVTAVAIVGKDGKVLASGLPAMMSIELGSDPIGREFNRLNEDRVEFAAPFGTALSPFGGRHACKFVGARFDDASGYVLLCYDESAYRKSRTTHIVGLTSLWHLGERGFVLIADGDGKLVSEPYEIRNKGMRRFLDEGVSRLAAYGITRDRLPEGEAFFVAESRGEKSLCRLAWLEGHPVVAVLPQSEIRRGRSNALAVTLVIQTIVFLFLFFVVMRFIRRDVVNDVDDFNRSLANLTAEIAGKAAFAHARSAKIGLRLAQDMKPKTMISKLRSRLVWSMLIAFAISLTVTWFVQDRFSKQETEALIRVNLNSLAKSLDDVSARATLKLTKLAAERLGTASATNEEDLVAMAASYGAAELDVVDRTATVIASSNPEIVGFDMKSGHQSAEFLCLLDGRTELAQKYGPQSFDGSVERRYVGVAFKDRTGFVQLGFDSEGYRKSVDRNVIGLTRHWHVGDSGFVVLARPDGSIISAPRGFTSATLDAAGIGSQTVPPEPRVFRAEVRMSPEASKIVDCCADKVEGYPAVACVDAGEVRRGRDVAVAVSAGLQILIYLALFTVVLIFVRRDVIAGVRELNESLMRINSGDILERVEIRSCQEFSDLSDNINALVDAVREKMKTN